mgnify:CR=1 FL=1
MSDRFNKIFSYSYVLIGLALLFFGFFYGAFDLLYALIVISLLIVGVLPIISKEKGISISIYLSRIYSILNRVDGVIDVRKVNVINKTGGIYSNITLDMDKILSKDGTFFMTPQNCIMELKYPDEDIKGIAK